MNQLHPRQDGSGGHAGTCPGITRQDPMRRARRLATRHRPQACEVLTAAAAHRRGRQPEKMVPRTGRQRLRFRWYRLGLTVQETTTTGRTVRLSANGRAPSKAHPAGSQMTTTSTGLATTTYQELAAAPRAAVITPADRGSDQAPPSWSQPC